MAQFPKLAAAHRKTFNNSDLVSQAGKLRKGFIKAEQDALLDHTESNLDQYLSDSILASLDQRANLNLRLKSSNQQTVNETLHAVLPSLISRKYDRVRQFETRDVALMEPLMNQIRRDRNAERDATLDRNLNLLTKDKTVAPDALLANGMLANAANQSYF